MTLLNKTVRELVVSGCDALKNAGIENSDFEALEICLSCTGIDKTSFLLFPEIEASEEEIKRFNDMISERIGGRPLQYILGEWSFFGRSFAVGEGVLIPRPETEQLADMCISEIKKRGFKTVFDLCAGSGCIGITIALECPSTEVWLFELFDGAFDFLKKNADYYQNGRIHTVRCDVLRGATEKLPVPELIVSNPPYIPTRELESLQSEVRREPVTALDGGENGLVFYGAVADKWLPLLRDGGFAAVEAGEGQSDEIANMFTPYGATNRVSDFYGVRRFVTLNKRRKENADNIV